MVGGDGTFGNGKSECFTFLLDLTNSIAVQNPNIYATYTKRIIIPSTTCIWILHFNATLPFLLVLLWWLLGCFAVDVDTLTIINLCTLHKGHCYILYCCFPFVFVVVVSLPLSSCSIFIHMIHIYVRVCSRCLIFGCLGTAVVVVVGLWMYGTFVRVGRRLVHGEITPVDREMIDYLFPLGLNHVTPNILLYTVHIHVTTHYDGHGHTHLLCRRWWWSVIRVHSWSW